jgi:hypothetical protein
MLLGLVTFNAASAATSYFGEVVYNAGGVELVLLRASSV